MDEMPQLDGELSALKIAAIQVHEQFLELKEAGFSHQDAIQLIGYMLTSGVLFTPADTFGFRFGAVPADDFNDSDVDLNQFFDEDDGDLDFPLDS